ncbi:MAG: hypothetical protein KIS66_08225 [Fimbriimonadaceae bacterium]|nr:hypothetical protein [Fimbriimonadaceae bacterium]
MFFSGRSKRLPYLSEYLRSRGARLDTFGPRGRLARSGLVWLLPAMGVLAVVSFVFPLEGVLLAAASLVAGFSLGRGAGAHQEPWPLTASQAVRTMLKLLEDRKLERALDPETAALAERGAEHWYRARAALARPTWQDGGLSANRRVLRAQLKRAVERAMDELAMAIAARVQPVANASGFTTDDPEPLPAPLVAQPDADARRLVDGLERVAAEIEAFSEETPGEVGSTVRETGLALELCLGEMRSIREAERELDDRADQTI